MAPPQIMNGFEFDFCFTKKKKRMIGRHIRFDHFHRNYYNNQ